MFIYSRTIRFADTDAAGVVYFATTLSICHEAFEDSIAAAGIDLKSFFSKTGIVVPIAHAEAEYHKPMVCGDKIHVQLTPVRKSKSRFEVSYQLLKINGEEPVSLGTAITEHVVIDAEIRRPIAITTELLGWIDRWQD